LLIVAPQKAISYQPSAISNKPSKQKFGKAGSLAAGADS
jgi:hypothetical protein